MIYNNLFHEADIPYDTLKTFGLSQEMIDDLPQEVMSNFLNGKPTPVLPIHITKEGKDINGEARISLYRKENDEVGVNFIPALETQELSEFTDDQIDQLLHGNVIVVKGHDNVGMAYVQYDEATKQAMSVPVDIVMHNIELILHDASHIVCLDRLAKGEVAELKDNDDSTISIGIDLNEKTGYRIAQGDKNIWQEQGRTNLDKYNFGLYGCWVIDPVDATAKYVPEEEYTENMLDEMKRIGQQRAAAAQMRGLGR